jgi:hypothetical protein
MFPTSQSSVYLYVKRKSTHGTSVRAVPGLRVNRRPSSGPSLPWQVPHRATALWQVAARDVGDVAVIQICNTKRLPVIAIASLRLVRRSAGATVSSLQEVGTRDHFSLARHVNNLGTPATAPRRWHDECSFFFGIYG